MTASPLVETRIAPPRFTDVEVRALLRDRWNVTGMVAALPSERDQNFCVMAGTDPRFVLKISEAREDVAVLECQHAVVERLNAAATGYLFPTSVPDRDGDAIGRLTGPDGSVHLVRLLRYVAGVPLATVRPRTPRLLREVGVLAAQVARALDGFSHPAARRSLRWDLRVGAQVVAQCRDAVEGPGRQACLDRLMGVVDSHATPLLAALRTSVIHNDANGYNVLVSAADPADPGTPRHVTGLVDFGDLVDSYTVGEVAVAAAYAMLETLDPLTAAADVVGGYHEAFALSEAELAAVFPLACLRLCTSAVLAAYQRAQEPGNAYLSISESPVWALLARLEGIDPRRAHYRFRQACGLTPWPGSARLERALADYGDRIGPVLDPDPAKTPRITLDLSIGSTEWSVLGGPEDATAWSSAVAARLAAAGAVIGVGRYDEPRRWYTTQQFAVPTDAGGEWRTVHIGVDLFAVAGTPVLAPLDGTVESVADHPGTLDYGPTVILRHEIAEAGVTFHTLYGHLDPDVLQRLKPGDRVRRGDRIARIGAPPANGGWAPHLHLQIIGDRLGFLTDFPGVARPSERPLWLSVSPDPNLILRLPEGCAAARAPAAGALLAARRRHIAPSLSIAYRAPLTIVRGWMQHLYDDMGRPYLDVVNNVAHVGHCHPRVVEALGAQSGVLNTNTRYLHPHLARYAERLTAHLPPPLRVCYFVCSGSEANELALRLARAHTGRRPVIVVDHAYHGNTTALVEVSPYKFDGPGGAGAPPHVHKVPVPDPYRGPYRGLGTGAGPRYAADVDAVIHAMGATGDAGVGAFFAEAIVSGAGMVEPPAGYLAAVYRSVRAAGGVCVADEVQTGFGRMGDHFWAFEAHGVVPDIVTMGKPMGNGHPLGAVVTTPEIAASFDNGMEYFNTFGGNPVSCAVGLAVLDVIEDDELQEHARRVGGRVAAGLRALMERHPVIADVRGRGLFLAIELVRDPGTREPAPRHAAYIVERMKDHGILVSTEGPYHSAIKMKPPLAFTAADADRLVDVLDGILRELPIAQIGG